MNKHTILIISILACCILFTQSVHSIRYIPPAKIRSSIVIFVDINNIDGPWLGTEEHPFEYISDGVAAAGCGDTVIVSDGMYMEHSISVNSSIRIIGKNPMHTILDCGYETFGFVINALNVYIENFTIRNTSGQKGSCGLYIGSDLVFVSNCTVSRARSGIIIRHSNFVYIRNSTFYMNGEGIYVDSSHTISMDGCEFCHNSIGANIQHSWYVFIEDCQAHENGIGMLTNASQNVTFRSTAFYDNNDNQGGCYISNSYNIKLYKCTIQHNGFGSRIKNSTNVRYEVCTIQYNTHFSFYVSDQSDIHIGQSLIQKNLRYGVYLYESTCTVSNCNIIDNSIDGIHLTDSVCDARYCFWGSRAGPFISAFRLIDRIKTNAGTLITRPWNKDYIENAGSDLVIEETFTKTRIKGYDDGSLILSGVDTDNDGAPDWWEEVYGYDSMVAHDHHHLDPDGDAITNVYECYAYGLGADPFRKDVFLEFDWMPGLEPGIQNQPPEHILDEIIQRFEEHNISLHIDVGENNGQGGEIPLVDEFTFDVLRDLYWEHFLNNDLTNPRKNIFHYGLICNTGPGNGFAFIGWGQLNAFCISASVLKDNNPQGDRGHLISSGSMHELGHNLGLFVDDCGGNDNTAATRPWYREFYEYWNYKSCMNYRYTYAILDYSDGQNGRNDYDDWGNLQFDFFQATAFDLPDRLR